VVLACVGASALVLVVTLAAALQARGLHGTPRWWRDAGIEAQGRDDAGIELENRISRALTRVRAPGDAEWHAAIAGENLNAWLVHRLEGAVRAHLGDDAWRDEIRVVRAQIDDGALTIGARLAHEHGASIVWARLELGVDEQGRFVVEPRRAYIGTTRVPVSWTASRLAPENLGTARIDLGDGREVVIRGVRISGGRLEFAMRTRRPGAS